MVVNKFLETKNIELTYQTQRNLIAGYEEDMVKYADNADKAQMYIISIMPLYPTCFWANTPVRPYVVYV